MYTLYFRDAILFIFIHVMVVFGQQSSQADIINICVNSTSCSHTYEQVYNSLAKRENNFNISYALYPGGTKLSSVRVFVDVYGPNKTRDSTPAKYTWSMSCLYTAVPALVLEVLSLGSILVTPRTQKLNIQMPPFCCNVSDNEEERRDKIEGFLTRGLRELQDLAVSPGIQDPKLNTAKCVIQGHELNICASERGPYIRTYLWCCLGFVVASGPLLGRYVEEIRKVVQDNTKTIKERNRAKAICFLCFALSALGSVTLIIALVLSSLCLAKGRASFDIPVILGVIIVYTLGVIRFCCLKCDYGNLKWYSLCPLLIALGASMTCYHFCWLMIGILINPTWGLTVALLVCSIFAALMYASYLYCSALNTTVTTTGNTTITTAGNTPVTTTGNTTSTDTDNNNTSDASPTDRNNCCTKLQTFLFCMAGFVAVLCLVVIVLFAGQSYDGRETADEVLKTALLYLIGAFFSWVTLRHPVHSPSSGTVVGTGQNDPPAVENGQNAPSAAGNGQNRRDQSSSVRNARTNRYEMERLMHS